MAAILIVDDEEGLREFLADALTSDGHQIITAANGLEALGKLRERAFDLLLTDLRMPGTVDGVALLGHARTLQPDIEAIVLTAFGTVESAVEAMKLGAFDYLQKPVASPAELRLVVARALERRRLLTGAAAVRETRRLPTLTWGDPVMRPVTHAIEKVSRTSSTVLLLGESGTGKELAALTIHELSARADRPFVPVNCAAFADSLMESEIFGHEKGAFTGAVATRRGRLELAEGGTFFLDEVGELKPELQAKLLRVLQERRYERVGGSRTMTADVRWIAATNRDLQAAVAQGTFREDLYHRLAVFPIALPPLRERRTDLMPMAEALLLRIGTELGRPGFKLDDEARDRISRAAWPGNVRELANALERAAILAEGNVIRGEDLTLSVPLPAGGATTGQTLDELERTAVLRTLDEVGGHRRKAAERLGIGERTLYEKLKRYGLT